MVGGGGGGFEQNPMVPIQIIGNKVEIMVTTAVMVTMFTVGTSTMIKLQPE